jgi:peptide/nickel transport system ATP-binding protein
MGLFHSIKKLPEVNRDTARRDLRPRRRARQRLGQILVRLIESTSGRLFYCAADVAGLPAAERRQFRHRVQMVFQDTNSSLNPRKRIRRVLSEALRARAEGSGEAVAIDEEIGRLMNQVGTAGKQPC